VAQDSPAPLIFIIAGTGAGYNSQKMKVLQRAFFQAGFHVLALSSPTHGHFIVSATRHEVKFRYYQSGSPFEYDLVRFLYKKNRELEIAK